MAQQARVPKFGNWESDGSVPYTQYFDNARKGKIAGKLINPNDPQENPESFPQDYPPVRAPPFRTSSDSDGPKSKNADVRRPPDSPLRHDAVERKLANPHRRASRMSAGSDRSLEQSPLHPNYQPKSGSRVGVNSPSWEKRGLEGHGLAPNTPGRARARLSGRDDGIPEKGSAVPKFGEWDEANPSTADGFTHIFNKVREEKQDGSGRVPTMSASSDPNVHKPDSSYESSGCGCFSWLKK